MWGGGEEEMMEGRCRGYLALCDGKKTLRKAGMFVVCTAGGI